jgi:pimeloyl-ACP methyl ester carboxylesterase
VYDSRQQGDDLVTLLEQLGAIPAVGIGSSFGAYILLGAAIRHPSTFTALVLCEPPMVPILRHHDTGSQYGPEFEQHVMFPSRDAFLKGHDEEALGIFIDGVRGQKGWFHRLLPSMRTELMKFAPEMRLEFLSDQEKYMMEITPEDLRSVRVPTLLVQGAATTPMFKSILDVLERNIPGAKRIEIPKAGHLAQIQNSAIWNEEVGKFLEGVGR